LNNNVRVRKAGVILIILSLLNLIGCSAIDKDTATQITTALQEKYVEEFKCDSIGNRFGTATNDTVTGYCYPSNEPEVLFTAVMDKDGNLVEDTYIPSYVTDILEKAIIEEFQSQEIVAHVNAVLSTNDEITDVRLNDLTLNNFLTEQSISGFTAHIIIDESSNVEKLGTSIHEVYSKLSEKYLQLVLGSYVRVLSNSDFSKCANEMDQNPTVSKTFFKDYDVKGEVIVGILDGKPTKEINEIQNELKSSD